MDDKEFQTRADEALKDLYDRLGRAMEDHPFEADFNAGALAIEFEEPSAQVRRESQRAGETDLGIGAHEKLQAGLGPGAACIRTRTGQTLVEIIDDAVGKQLGTKVEL